MFLNDLTELRSKEKLFEGIYASHFKKVVFYAYNYLKNSEKAESIAQDVFLALWEHMDDLDESGEILPYLFVLTKYRCLNWLRREKHYGKYAKEKMTGYDVSMLALREESSISLYSKEVNGLVGKALKEMPDKVRETFVFSRFRELKNREIAIRQNISEKTVEYRISCAFKILRKILKDYTLVSIFVSASSLVW